MLKILDGKCKMGEAEKTALTAVYDAINLDKETSGGHTALESASILPLLKYLRGVMAAA